MTPGDLLSNRALFGRPIKCFDPVFTLYKSGSPLASIGNLSWRSPDDCRISEVRREFDGAAPDWLVLPSSCRSGAGWLFYAVIHRKDVDPHAFDNLTIGGGS